MKESNSARLQLCRSLNLHEYLYMQRWEMCMGQIRFLLADLATSAAQAADAIRKLHL